MKRISASQVQSSERFYRIPKIFVESPLYKQMSTDAKFTYAILKDRFELSLRNNWIDKNGDVYLIYTITELQEILGYGNKKVIKLKKELQEYGLLDEVRQGLNKPNLLYLGNIDYQAFPTEETHSNPSETAEMSKRHANDTENNETELSNDTNRYEGESSLSNLSISEAFKMGQHGFLSPQLVQKLSLFGKDAKILENKIYQSKRQVEKNYNNLLADQEIYGEVWLQDLERELDKLIFKIKTGEAEGKTIQNVPAYFYKMMMRFWKMALLIEKEQGFLEVSGQSEHARKFPDECPSLIAHYYPDKLTDTKLNQYLAELSKGTTTC